MNPSTQQVINQSKKGSLIALCLGFFMVMMDVTVINVALPNIERDLGGGVSGLQWVMDSYTLTFACLLLSAGRLADLINAKKVFIWGLALFVLSSIACGMATSLWILILSRLIQGIAAALIVPTSLALISASYNDNEARAHAIGIWGGIAGIAAAIGPVLGACLTEWWGWRSVFFINLPFGLLALFLTLKHVLDTSNKTLNHLEKNFDIPGQVVGIISIGLLAFSVIEAGRLGWTSPLILIGFCLFLFTMFLFIVIEKYSAHPMLSLNLFKSKTFSTAMLVGLIISLGSFGEMFMLSLYFQQIRDYSVLLTGLAILPHTAFSPLFSYLGGKMASILGPRLPIIIGLTVGATGFLVFLLLMLQTEIPLYYELILPIAAIGFGVTFTYPATTIAVVHAAPKEQAGIASGAFTTGRQIGTLIGVAIFGTVISTSTHFVTGMQWNLVIGCVLFSIGCLMTLRWIR